MSDPLDLRAVEQMLMTRRENDMYDRDVLMEANVAALLVALRETRAASQNLLAVEALECIDTSDWHDAVDRLVTALARVSDDVRSPHEAP